MYMRVFSNVIFGDISELTTAVLYGFIILAMLVKWPSESNTFMLLFCLSNGILSLIGAFKPVENGIHCHTNGLLSK